MTLHVPFKTLVIAYILFKMCLVLAIVNILIRMHLSHNSILDVFFETQTKIHCAFQMMKNSFYCNPMWLSRIGHKPVHNPQCKCNIRTYAYHYIHDISNNILKWDNPHCFQVYITLRIHILSKLAIGHKNSFYVLTFSHSKLPQFPSKILALVSIIFLVLLNTIYLYL